MICHSIEETRHIPLYCFGSEGLDVCHSCEMKLVEFVRQLRSEEMKKKIKEVLARKGILNERII